MSYWWDGKLPGTIPSTTISPKVHKVHQGIVNAKWPIFACAWHDPNIGQIEANALIRTSLPPYYDHTYGIYITFGLRIQNHIQNYFKFTCIFFCEKKHYSES